jgi:hypothetical protein
VLGIARPELSRLGTLFPGMQLPGWAGLVLLMGVILGGIQDYVCTR